MRAVRDQRGRCGEEPERIRADPALRGAALVEVEQRERRGEEDAGRPGERDEEGAAAGDAPAAALGGEEGARREREVERLRIGAGEEEAAGEEEEVEDGAAGERFVLPPLPDEGVHEREPDERDAVRERQRDEVRPRLRGAGGAVRSHEPSRTSQP